jgi:hypothetical protein
VTAREINRRIGGDPATDWVAHPKRHEFETSMRRDLSPG